MRVDNASIAARTVLLTTLASLAAGVVAGCGDNHHASTSTPVTISVSAGTTRPTTTASGPDRHALARAYVRIMAPANAAHRRFLAKSRAYSTSTTKAQVVADLAPVIAAYRAADTRLLRVRWPRPVRADARAQVAADGVLLRTLEAASTQNAASVGSWFTRVSQDWGASTDAENTIRADLGLPPRLEP